jgi:hypothetical protein
MGRGRRRGKGRKGRRGKGRRGRGEREGGGKGRGEGERKGGREGEEGRGRMKPSNNNNDITGQGSVIGTWSLKLAGQAAICSRATT